MNLTELSALLDQATDVLRVETLDAYQSASDGDMLDRYSRGEPKPDPSEKQPWLDRLAAAAQRGHPWRRLRVVSRPVPTYVRYACEFGYVDNVAAGEDVRVLDEASQSSPNSFTLLRAWGDLLVLDRDVVFMEYESGRFTRAWEADIDYSWSFSGVASEAWRNAEPFTQWWADNPCLHRNLAAT